MVKSWSRNIRIARKHLIRSRRNLLAKTNRHDVVHDLHTAVTQSISAWLVKHHPELKDSQIVKLIGTTKETITKIRERTHWNISNISAKHPAMLGLCKQTDLDAAIEKAGGTHSTAAVAAE